VEDLTRCGWATSTPDYVAYHDDEWGTPLHGDDALFERLCLEAFQSGLSWITILRKRPAFRAAFAGFSVDAVAEFGPEDEARLLADAGIVRNRAKILATIAGSRAFLAIEEREGFSHYLWKRIDGHPVQTGRRGRADIPAETDLSRAISRDLRAEGFNFVGPTIVYAFMQAVGMVNDHLVGCFRHGECAACAGAPGGAR
jgi:DNA-3-methyladenine glycosylase I